MFKIISLYLFCDSPRLHPATGETRLVTAPTLSSRPDGVKIASDYTIWLACNGWNCLLNLEPDTMEMTEIQQPEEDTMVRRLEMGPDGTIWWVNSGLVSYDLRRASHPDAIAFIDGAVRYNESGVRPDILVRFETFQNRPIPSGDLFAGILRHMRVSRNGKALLIHQSAANRVPRVSIGH